MTITIPNMRARRHAMRLAGLLPERSSLQRKEQLAATILGLGFVQVDSVNVLERAHHHILFSRCQSYRRRDLSYLIEKDRSLFENWTHDAAVIPCTFYPYWQHRFAREKTRLRQRWKTHFGQEGFDRDLERVLGRIAANGPAMARDFEGDKPSTGWWDWHPSKAALEFLWRTGELAITRREGFQKVYDLSERVIPGAHRDVSVDREAFVDWACRSALKRLGFATRGEVAAFWALLTPQEVDVWLTVNRDELVVANVEAAGSAKPRPSFAFPDAVEAAMAEPEVPDRVRILSPFDPLLRDRARTERLFGFTYRIEIFVPQAKRQYGYYVYPVLRGDKAIGRIDVKADREADALVVSRFWPEAGVRRSAMLVKRLEAELERLRRFAEVGRLHFVDGWLP